MSSRHLGYLFCDLDGTLLHAPYAGRSAFQAAFLTAFGVTPDMSEINFAGATDLGVLDILVRQCEVSMTSAKVERFFQALTFELDQKMKKHPPEVYPGVKTFLQRVALRWNLGLVTGNSYSSAQVKIRHAGLDSFFNKVGGFGDEHADRSRMVALALQRAGNPKRGYLLGDTPSDIQAAKENNLIAVAVCNGVFDRSVLEDFNPDWILNSFEEAEDFLEELGV